MAKVIADQPVVVQTWQPWVRVGLIGAVVGIIFWILTIILTKYVVEPLACRQLMNAAVCINSTGLGGNIATIMAAILAVLILVRQNVTRPIILAVASAALLWDLSAWTQGLFWLESFAWALLLYAGSYLLFAYIARYFRLWVVIATSLAIILIIRIALVL